MPVAPRALELHLREVRAPFGIAPILYVHGLGESGACFARIASCSKLRSSLALIPDLPGHGRSARPLEPPSLVELADRLASLASEHSSEPVLVLGHSLGGVLSLLLAERHPSLVRALVNVEGNISDDDTFLSGMAARQTPRAFAARGFEEIRSRARRTGRGAAFAGYVERMSECDPGVFHHFACQLVGLSSTGELAPRLARLSVPCLYVAGDRGAGGIGKRSLRLLRAAAVRTVIIPGAGHWPFVDDPDAFAGVVGDFLRLAPRLRSKGEGEPQAKGDE